MQLNCRKENKLLKLQIFNLIVSHPSYIVMSILPGNDINSWERINDLANIFSISFGLLTTACAIILFFSGAKIQSLREDRLVKIQAESNIKIAESNSISETAKVDAARANGEAAKASLGAELAKESASKANERTELMQNENKQLDIEQSRLTQENVKLRLDLEREVSGRLKIQEHLTHRKLGDQGTFAKILMSFAGMNVNIKYMNDIEAESISGQLHFIFRMAKWNVKSVEVIERETSGIFGQGGIYVCSLRAGISNPQDHSQEVGYVLNNELKNRGLVSATRLPYSYMGGEYLTNTIDIIIALKPKVNFEEDNGANK